MLGMAGILLIGDHDHDSCSLRMPEDVCHVLGTVRKQQLRQMETFQVAACASDQS